MKPCSLWDYISAHVKHILIYFKNIQNKEEKKLLKRQFLKIIFHKQVVHVLQDLPLMWHPSLNLNYLIRVKNKNVPDLSVTIPLKNIIFSIFFRDLITVLSDRGWQLNRLCLLAVLEAPSPRKFSDTMWLLSRCQLPSVRGQWCGQWADGDSGRSCGREGAVAGRGR